MEGVEEIVRKVRKGRGENEGEGRGKVGNKDMAGDAREREEVDEVRKGQEKRARGKQVIGDRGRREKSEEK